MNLFERIQYRLNEEPNDSKSQNKKSSRKGKNNQSPDYSETSSKTGSMKNRKPKVSTDVEGLGNRQGRQDATNPKKGGYPRVEDNLDNKPSGKTKLSNTTEGGPVKVTKTKVLAAFGQLVDVIFGTGKFPIGISETNMPEGEKENAYLDANNPTAGIESNIPDNIGNRLEDAPVESIYDVGYEGDGRTLKPGVTFGSGSLLDGTLEQQADDLGILKEGASPNPQQAELSPAKRAARRMEKLIHDQIEESNGSSEIRNALLESALLGTGIVKGPFNFNKQLNNWNYDEEGIRNYSPLEVRVPRIEFVSCWDFYPDPAATNIDECEYVVHRHKMNKSQLRQLRNMPYFNKDVIRECLQEGANYTEKDFESQLKDDSRADYEPTSNFEVLEYWGIMDAEYAREVGIELPDSVDDLDEVQINAWICGDLSLIHI